MNANMTDEKTRLVTPSERQRIYTVAFVRGDAAPVFIQREEASLSARRWRSIWVVYFTMFLGGLSFSILMSSCWPYLQQTDKESTESFVGWVVAADSFGQLVAAPLIGAWADRRSLKEPMICSLILQIAGNILYTYAGVFENNARFAILSARILVGIGAGNMALCRSYAGMATNLEERIGAMTMINAFQSIGFILGPVLQLVVVLIVGEKGVIWHAIKLHINMYTVPMFVLVFLIICNILLVVLMFKEYYLYSDSGDEEGSDPNMGSRKSIDRLVPFDRVAAASCLVIIFIIVTVYTLTWTVTTPLTMNEYGWTREQAVFYSGIFFAAFSTVSVFTYMGIPFLSKRVEERLLLTIGIVCLLLSIFIFLPWGDKYPPLKGVPSTLPGMNLTVTGCPVQYDWCHTVPVIYVEQVIAGLCWVAVGFPLSTTVVFTLYSKILGPFPQSTMMGWLTSSASLAQAVGPMVVAVMYTSHGPRVIFSSTIGLILFILVCIFIAYKRLVPYRFRFEEE